MLAWFRGWFWSHTGRKAVLLGVTAFLFFAAVWVIPPHSTSRDVLQPPSSKHWLGTNDIGQDVLVGLLNATPITLLIASSTAFLSLSISIGVAFIAAIRGGVLAGLVLRTVDILQAIPSVLILLLMAVWLQPSVFGIIFLLSMTTWHDDVRVLQAIILREMTRDNVHYARRLGGTWRYCLVRHILPSAWPATVSLYVQHIRQAALKTAGLGFLGLIDPRLVTWGSMMQDALDYLYATAWYWLLIPPALCLTCFLLLVLSIGDKIERYATKTIGY